MNIPPTITVNDTPSWTDDPVVLNGVRYDSGRYALAYEIRGPVSLTLTAAVNGQGWKTVLGAVQSATLAAGQYWWQAVVTRTGERITVSKGELTVEPDLAATASVYDGRTIAEKALADAEAALASFRSSNGKVKRYTIGSRSMEFATIAELLQVVNYWRVRVMNESTRKSIANGHGNPRNLLTRFR